MQTVETQSGRSLWLAAIPLAIFGAVVGFLAYMLLLDDRDPSYMPSALIGQPAPGVAGPSLLADMPEVTDAVFAAGKPVLVNFFASWCVPCKVEHPVLTSLSDESGVQMIGINYKDDTTAAQNYLAANGNPYAGITVDQTGAISVNWGVTGLPETFIVDASGTVIYRHFGPVAPNQRDELLAILRDAL